MKLNVSFLLPIFFIFSCQHSSNKDETRNQNNPTLSAKVDASKTEPFHITKQESPLVNISCQFFDRDELTSCFQIVEANDNEQRILHKQCKEGKVVYGLCPLDNSLGQCLVSNGSMIENHIHYKSIQIPQLLDKVKNNCSHNSGTWKELDLDMQLLNEMKEAYQKRFDEENKIKTMTPKEFAFREKFLEEVYQSMQKNSLNTFANFAQFKAYYNSNRKPPSQWALLQEKFSNFRKKHPEISEENALKDPSWYDPYKVEVHRAIWEDLNSKGGGCGTLSSFLCMKNKSVGNVSLEKIDEYYEHSEGTSSTQRMEYFESSGLCTAGSFQVKGDSCESYEEMKEWENIGCSLEIVMRNNEEGHVEFLYNIIHSKTFNFCYGLSNSWGKPAIFSGGVSNFFHSKFEKFANANYVTYMPICPCSSQIMNSSIYKKMDTKFLVRAVERGDTKLLQELLKLGGNVNKERNENGYNLIHLAIDEGNSEILKILVRAGAKVNTEDSQGQTPLELAIILNKSKIVKQLIKAGAYVNKIGKSGYTPLHHIFSMPKYNLEIVKELLKAGADPNIKDENGVSPLDIAKKRKQSDIVKLFKKAVSGKL